MTEIQVFDFNGLHIKTIDKVLSANLRDALDGECTFEFSTLADRTENVSVGCGVRLLIDNTSYHFKLVRVAKSLSNTLSICNFTCEHLSYELNDEQYNLESFDFTGSPIDGLKALLQGTNLVAGVVEFTQTTTMKINQKCSRRAALMQYIAILGGEISYNNNAINIHVHRGETGQQEMMGGKSVSDVSVVHDSRSGTSTYGLKLYKKLDFGVGDEVHIVFSPFDLNAETRIIAMTYNPFNRMEIVIDVGEYIPTVSDNLYKLEEKIKKTKDEINSLSEATAAIKIGTNSKDVSIGVVTTEILKIAYSALKNTYAVFVTTVKFNVEQAGEFLFLLLFNNDVVMEYTEHFDIGFHTKTFSYPFASMKGLMNIRLRGQSEDGTAILPKMQSWGYVMGAYLAKDTPWDGTLYFGERFPPLTIAEIKISILRINTELKLITQAVLTSDFQSHFAEISMTDEHYSTRNLHSTVSVSSNVVTAFFIDLTHIGIRFQNPVVFDGEPVLSAFSVAGGVAGSLVAVAVIMAETVNDTVILTTSNFQTFDQDFLVGYTTTNLKSALTGEMVESFSLPFSKTEVTFAISRITATSENTTTQTASNLISTDNTKFWSPTSTDTEPIIYVVFSKFTRLSSYAFRSRSDNITGSPKAWTVEVLGQDGWLEIDNRANQSWAKSEEKSYALEFNSYFQMLRIRFIAFNSASYQGFSKLNFTEVI